MQLQWLRDTCFHHPDHQNLGFFSVEVAHSTLLQPVDRKRNKIFGFHHAEAEKTQSPFS